jgi:hypothetical protein
MKTLLCPVDFSPSSKALARYAAQLASDMEAKVVLTATNPVLIRVPAGEWSKRDVALAHLDDWHDWIASEWHVHCDSRREVILNQPYKQLGILSDQFDMLLLGSQKNKSNWTQTYAGLDLLRVIRETLAPIMIVPEKYTYTKVKRLLYAYDYQNEPEPPLQQIKWLANWFKAEVTFISILPGELPVREEDKLNITQDKINAQWASEKQLRFETIVHDNVARCLEHYLSLWERNDLLVLSVNHSSMLEKLWHKSVVRQLLKYGTHPYVILHK